MDQLIDILWLNELKPGFELMGNPSNIYHNFENNTEVYLWRDFIKILSKRYIRKYGLNFVKQWNFETWNEPDHPKTLGFNFTIKVKLIPWLPGQNLWNGEQMPLMLQLLQK